MLIYLLGRICADDFTLGKWDFTYFNILKDRGGDCNIFSRKSSEWVLIRAEVVKRGKYGIYIIITMPCLN